MSAQPAGPGPGPAFVHGESEAQSNLKALMEQDGLSRAEILKAGEPVGLG